MAMVRTHQGQRHNHIHDQDVTILRLENNLEQQRDKGMNPLVGILTRSMLCLVLGKGQA